MRLIKKFAILLCISFSLIFIFDYGWCNYETVFAGNPPMIGSYEAKFTDIDLKDSFLKKVFEELILNLDYSKAIELLEKRKSEYFQSPYSSDYYTLSGYCYFNAGDYNLAEELLLKSIDNNQKNYISLYLLGNLYFIKGDNQKSIHYLEKSLEVKPTFVMARRVLAQIYIDLKEYDNGIRHYQEIVNLLPNSGYYLYQLYSAYYKASRYEQALEVLKKMINLQPNLFINYSRLADVYINLGKLKESEEISKKLLNYPDNSIKAEGYYYLATIELKQKDLSKAKEYINQAYSLKQDSTKELLKYKIDSQIKEQLKSIVSKLIFLFLIILLLTTALSFIYYYRNQKEIEKINKKIEKVIEEVDNLQYFCSLFVNFITEAIKKVEFSLFLINNTSSFQLYTIYSSNVPKELSDLKIMINTDPREIINKRFLSNELIPLKSLSPRLISLLEEVFPSLIERIIKAEANYIIPLIDKKNVKGIIILKTSEKFNFLKLVDINTKVNNIILKLLPYLDSFLFHESAILDETTNLYNRRFFENTFQNELKRAERYSLNLSLIVCDLDNFKKINDTFGHLVGDRILRETASIIKNNLREGIDIAARWGGEEFVILLPSTDKESAHKIAERIRVNISSHKYGGVPENYIITGSFGVASYPIDAKTKNELFKKADEAAYQAKKQGKNKVVLATEQEKTEKAEKKQDSSREPRIDPLTNLYLKTEFLVDFEKEIKRSRRYTLPLSIITVKPLILFQTNDNDVIMSIASKIGKDIHENIRFGIDLATFDKEKRIFIILLPHTEKNKAHIVSKRLFTKLSDYGTVLQSIVSFPDDGLSISTLMDKLLKLLDIATPDEPIQSLSKYTEY